MKDDQLYTEESFEEVCEIHLQNLESPSFLGLHCFENV